MRKNVQRSAKVSALSIVMAMAMLFTLLIPVTMVAYATPEADSAGVPLLPATSPTSIFDWGDNWDFVEPNKIPAGFIATWSDPDYDIATEDSIWRNGVTPVVTKQYSTAGTATYPDGTAGVDFTTLDSQPASAPNPADGNNNRHPVIFRKVISAADVATIKGGGYTFNVNFNAALAIWIDGTLYTCYGMRTGYVPSNAAYGYPQNYISAGSYNTSRTTLLGIADWSNAEQSIQGKPPGPFVDALTDGQDNVILIAVFNNSGSDVTAKDFYFDAFLGKLIPPAYETPGTVEPSNPMQTAGVLVSKGSKWHYQKSGWQETDWITTFSNASLTPNDLMNDTAKWLCGSAPLGYGKFPGNTLGTVIGKATNYKPHNLPYNFRTVFPYSASAYAGQETFQMNVWYDDGFAVWINGELICWKGANNSAELQTYGYPESSDGFWYDDCKDWFSITNDNGNVPTLSIIDIPASKLIDGDNVILASAFNVTPESSDLYFDLELKVPEPETKAGDIISFGSKWDYIDTGEPPQDWLQKLDTFTWKNGRAPLGRAGGFYYNFSGISGRAGNFNVSTAVKVASVSGLPFDDRDEHNFPVIFRKEFNVADKDDIISMIASARFEDGIAIWLNGNLVIWKNVPTGRNDEYYNSFTNQTYTMPGGIPGESALVDGKNPYGYPLTASIDGSEYTSNIATPPYEYSDRIDGRLLVNGTNTLVVAVFDDWGIDEFENVQAADVYFDLQLVPAEIEPYKIDYVALSPGANETEVNVTWWIPWGSAGEGNTGYGGEGPAKVQLDDDGDFSNGIIDEFDGRVENATNYFDTCRATIEGLEPDKTYYYRVGSGFAGEWGDWTAMTTGKNPKSHDVIVVSDAQIDTTISSSGSGPASATRGTAVNWAKTLEEADARAATTGAEGGASFIIHAGDVVDSTILGTQMQQFQFHFNGVTGATGSPTLIPQLAKLPFFVAPGNHDEYTSLLPKHYTYSNDKNHDPLDADGFYGASNAGRDYWYRHGDTLYLSVNSGAPWSVANNAPSDEEIAGWVAEHRAFLRDATAANPDVKWKIVVMHFDVYGAGYHAISDRTNPKAFMLWDAGDVREFLCPVFDEFGVDLVINGHEHLYSRSFFMKKHKTVSKQTMASVDKAMSDINPGTIISPKGIVYITMTSASAMKNNKPYTDPEYTNHIGNPEEWLAYYVTTLEGADQNPARTQYSIMTVDDNSITYVTYWTVPGTRNPIVDSITIKKVPDYDALDDLIKSCENLDRDDFAEATDEAWNDFIDAIDAAKTVEADADPAAIADAFDTLYAAYRALTPTVMYTVSFDIDGIITPQAVEDCDEVAKPDDPEKEGYVFIGWYLGNKEYDFDTPVTEDITLTAKWKAIYTVSFDVDGEVTTEKVVDGMKVAKPDDPKKSGYTFIGWYLGEAEFNFDTPVTGNITLKATWKEIVYPPVPPIQTPPPPPPPPEETPTVQPLDKVTVTASESSEEQTAAASQAVNDAAGSLGAAGVTLAATGDPVNVEIPAASKGKPTAVTVTLPESTNLEKMTVMAIVNADGTLTAVPTKINADGTVTVILSDDCTLVPLSAFPAFIDIGGHWGEADINNGAARLLLFGVGGMRYAPNSNMTAAQAYTAMLRAMGIAVANSATGPWYSDAVAKAESLNLILEGIGPESAMTRIQAASLMVKALKSMGMNPSMTIDKAKDTLEPFNDVSDLSDSQKIDMAICVALGIFRGNNNGTMTPNNPLLRVHLASITQRLQDVLLG